MLDNVANMTSAMNVITKQNDLLANGKKYNKVLYKVLVLKSKSQKNKENDLYCGECAADDLDNNYDKKID